MTATIGTWWHNVGARCGDMKAAISAVIVALGTVVSAPGAAFLTIAVLEKLCRCVTVTNPYNISNFSRSLFLKEISKLAWN